MMKKIVLIMGLFSFLLFATNTEAQTPPPPNNGTTGSGGSTPVGGGAPIGSSLAIMLSLGLGYGTKKFFNNRKSF